MKYKSTEGMANQLPIPNKDFNQLTGMAVI
jgi:hypothetical protein